jgi:sulfur-oxidizing protein SoxY
MISDDSSGAEDLLGLSRRAAILASIAAAAVVMAPQLAFASADKVQEELKKLFGDRKPVDGKVKIEAPQIAENGLVVPITVEVESPMTEASHVKSLHVFADGNPLPGVASFRFTPASGRAMASTRMRLAQTQNIICVAEMSDGALHVAKTEVKVTIGGCGG